MASQKNLSSSKDRTIAHPNAMEYSELLEMSLSQLSKNLPTSTSSTSTMSIYLRWLEVHRVEVTKLTEHWSNTLSHWTYSLLSRNFTEAMIISGVEKWTKANAPLRIVYRRGFPTQVDIHRAKLDYELNRQPVEQERFPRPLSDSRRPSNEGRYYETPQLPHYLSDENNRWKTVENYGTSYYEPPPMSYTCHRCGQKGHHLQVCPTNLDPSYDRAPSADYICIVCNATGDHYKSLCSLNEDPLCIFQKRKAWGIETPSQKRSNIFESWERDRHNRDEATKSAWSQENEHQPSQVFEQELSTTAERSSPTPRIKVVLEKLREIEEEKAILFREESMDLDELIAEGFKVGRQDSKRMRSSKSQNISHSEQIDREFATNATATTHQLARTNIGETGDLAMEQLKMRDTTPSSSQNTSQYGYESDNRDGSDTEMASSYTIIQGIMSKGVSLPISKKFTPNHGRRTTTPLSVDKYDLGSCNNTEKGYAASQVDREYNDVVKRLTMKHPEMNEVVNSVKRRPTALDMWEEDDFQREKGVNSNVTETPMPLSSPQGNPTSPESQDTRNSAGRSLTQFNEARDEHYELITSP